jgi:hypothetical protein
MKYRVPVEKPTLSVMSTNSVTSTGRVAPIAQVGTMNTANVRRTRRSNESAPSCAPTASMMPRLKKPNAPIVNSIREKIKIRRCGKRSASQPPAMAPTPSPSMNTDTMVLTESRSTPNQANSSRCQAT